MSCELDPKEVLIHLHELGYYNITPEQLKEFIKDLEKLIQHDVMNKKKKIVQQHCQDDSLSSPLPNTTDESVSSSPPPASDPPDHRNHSHAVRKPSKNLENISCSSSESSVAPTRRVLRECTKHLSLKNQEREELFRCRPKSADASNSKAPLKPPKTCDCAWRRIGCKCCEELMSQEQNSLKTKSKENLAPPRPKSSFIRTWQTQAGSYRTQRCDPVALYQQYQQVWKQQKLPGEDNHNDLRWSVRERLLGQQPLPRVPQRIISISIAEKHMDIPGSDNFPDEVHTGAYKNDFDYVLQCYKVEDKYTAIVLFEQTRVATFRDIDSCTLDDFNESLALEKKDIEQGVLHTMSVNNKDKWDQNYIISHKGKSPHLSSKRTTSDPVTTGASWQKI